MIPVKRFFIVGCPRSGTTLLQCMLAACGEIYSFPETHLFRKGLGRTGVQLGSPLKRRALLDAFAREMGFSDNDLDTRQRSGLMGRGDFINGVSDILDLAALRHGCVGWIEKTPEHIFYIDEIEAAMPGAKFIHIVRNGGPVSASVVKMWEQFTASWPLWRRSLMALNDMVHAASAYRRYKRPGLPVGLTDLFRHRRFVRAVELWNDSLLETKRHGDLMNHFICRYEELVAEPERVLRSLCDFLGVEFREAMLDFKTSSSRAGLIRPDEPWKKYTLDNGIRPASAAKFMALDPSVRGMIERLLVSDGDVATLLGK